MALDVLRRGHRGRYAGNNARSTCVCGSVRQDIPDRIFEVTDKEDDPILPRYYYKCSTCTTYSAPNIYFPLEKYETVPLEYITITDLKQTLNDARVERLSSATVPLADDPVLYDLGSGEGCFTHTFVRRHPHSSAIACEADDRLRLKFYADDERVTFLNEFIEDFLDRQIASKPFPPADLVVLTDVLEHVVEPELLLSKLQQVMSPGGLAYLVVPNASTLGAGRKRSARQVDWAHANRTCQHIWMYDHGTFVDLVARYLQVVEKDETFETDLRRDSVYTAIVARKRSAG